MSDEANSSGGGWKIPFFGEATGRTAIRSSDANDLVWPLNALGNIVIVRTQNSYDEIIYSDSNIIIALKQETQPPNVEGSITIEEMDGSPSVDNVTTLKFPNGSVTDEGSGVVSITVAAQSQAYKIVSESSEYLICHTWDGSTEGSSSITVAKPPYLRSAPTSDGAATILPLYSEGDVIWADSVNYTGVSGATLLDKNVDARRWVFETEGCDSDGNAVTASFDRTIWSS